MGRITGSWERPIQGVSQQSDKDRIDGQCTKQENLTPSPLYGLMKRVGTRHIKKLMETVSPDALWYEYNRGDDEQYIILIEPMSYPRVFDLDGTEHTVKTNGLNDNYLKVSKPKDVLRMKTIADYTFILNNSVVTATRADKVPENPNTAIVYCQYATYGRDYIINIDGKEVARYTTPDGSTSAHINLVKTDYVATQLANDLKGRRIHSEELTVTEHVPSSQGGRTYYTATTTNTLSKVVTLTKLDGSDVGIESTKDNTLTITGVSDGEKIWARYYTSTNVQTEYRVMQHANCLFVTRLDGAEFSISTSDSAGGDDLVAVQDSVQQVSNLPPYAPDGYVVKIQNKEGYDANSFWLKAEPQNSEKTGSRIKWVEAVATGELLGFDKNTMPHQLVSDPDGTFTLSYGEWEDRKVGNDTTNPFPSFVGQPVQSIGTFQNRMVLTSGESAIFGSTNNFFDMFRETTQTESASDPIDAFADADEINNLLHHAVLDGDIVFFAENGQFLIKGDKPITKDDLVFTKTTSYPINVKAAPSVTGESIMFSFIAGRYAGLREMFTDSLTDTKRARPITEHVSEYIEGVPVDLVTSPNINLLLVRTDKSDNVIYAYNWLWSGEQKVQAAFHKWVFTGSVLFAKFVGDRIFFIVDRGNGVYLEQMPISNDEDDNGLDFPARLDQRSVVDATWTGSRWDMSPNYLPSDNSLLEFVRGEGCWDADKGTSVIFETDGTKYWTYDDLADWQGGVTSCKLTMGTKYTSKFIPTQPSIKDRSGRVMGLDRFTLGKVTLNYESIGSITVFVKDLHYEQRQWKYEYNGRRMGGWNNRVGFAPLATGKFAFPVRLPSEQVQFEIITDDYRPFILRDMEWEGMFKQRGRRI